MGSAAGSRSRLRDPQVYWRVRGRGPCLVLVNGYSASAMAWPGGWLGDLQRFASVVTLDVRGSGWSRLAETPFTMADLAGDVCAVLDAAEVERATVLGLSMGGMVAQEVALRAPERVAALVLVATRPPVPAFHRPALSTTLRLVLPPAPGESLDRYFRRLWTAAAAPGFAERHPDLIDELTRQTVERPTPRAGLLHQLRAMTGWGHAERLARIDAPTAVVHGTLDRFAPVENGRELARRIPHARYTELADVGHLVPHEAPEALTEVIRGQLEAAGGVSGGSR